MTEVEYKRWKSFSLRMAHRGFSLRLRASRRKLADFVKDFFRLLDSDYFCVNEVLPVQIDRFGLDSNSCMRRYEFLRDRIVDWDHTESHPTYRDQYGHSTIGPYICDIVSGRMDSWNPFYYGDDRRYKQWDELWGDRIRCCLRAGIDMAVSPSAGVLGFTVGDVRRMYRRNVPQWLFSETPDILQQFISAEDSVGVWL